MFIIVSTAMPQLMIFSRHARQRFHERIVKKVEPHHTKFHQFVWKEKNTRSCISGMRSVSDRDYLVDSHLKSEKYNFLLDIFSFFHR